MKLPYDKLIASFKNEVKNASQNPSFIHYEWFVTYHLEIVEKIALELCEKYPAADKGFVMLLVWLHDYCKVIDHKNQYKATALFGEKKLLEIGFPKDIVEKALEYIDILDKKIDLAQAPIEVQIVSSADGASHLVGPFFAIYWKEYSQDPCEEIIQENKRKALVDWKKKITLPEIKEAFLERHKFLLEFCGEFPERFLP